MSKKSESTQTLDTASKSAAARKMKLGKGLGALLGETKREEPLVQSSAVRSNAARSTTGSGGSSLDSPLKTLSIASIEPLAGNPRKHFDESALDELAASIASRGVIQPIIVCPQGNGKYQLVAGERRWRAAQRARLHEIPALGRANRGSTPSRQRCFT